MQVFFLLSKIKQCYQLLCPKLNIIYKGNIFLGNIKKEKETSFTSNKGRSSFLYVILYSFLYIFMDICLSIGNKFFGIRVGCFCVPHQV